MPNPVLKQVQLPSGSIYDLQDARVDNIIDLTVVDFIGVSSTPITDGGIEKPTIAGEQVDPKQGDIVIYGKSEYIFGTDNRWHEMGDVSDLGDLAFKDEATGTVTLNHGHTATSTQPVFTGSQSDVSLSVTSDENGNYTPSGTISQPTFTGSSLTSTGSFTPEGTITFDDASEQHFVVNGGEGEATYTPAGTVSAPVITITPTTSVVKSVDEINTVATEVVAAAPGATAPQNNLIYYAVDGDVLKFYQIGFNTGASITSSDATVMTSAVGSATAPTFTGSGTRLSGSVTTATSATFVGSSGNVSVTGTPQGTVSAPTFTGNSVEIGGTVTPQGTVSAPEITVENFEGLTNVTVS